MFSVTVFIVKHNDEVLLLRRPRDGGIATDYFGRKYTPHDDGGDGRTRWQRDGTTMWTEEIASTMWLNLEGSDHDVETFEVFIVEEKTYVDQWGFKRTEKAKTATQRLTEYPSPAANFAHDTAGNIYMQIEENGSTLKWWRTRDNTSWYQEYPGQLMENHLIGDLVTKITSRRST